MGDRGTSWIMAEDASVENKVFRTNFNHLVYTSMPFICMPDHIWLRRKVLSVETFVFKPSYTVQYAVFY